MRNSDEMTIGKTLYTLVGDLQIFDLMVKGLTVRSQSVDINGQHCPCPVIVSFCPDLLFGLVCPDSVFVDFVRCDSGAVRILSGFFKKCCPLSVHPAGQGRDKAVRVFGILVRRRLPVQLRKYWLSKLRTDVLINLQSINNLNIDKRHPS